MEAGGTFCEIDGQHSGTLVEGRAPALFLVHFPRSETPMCCAHAQRAFKVADAEGMPLRAAVLRDPDATPCASCGWDPHRCRAFWLQKKRCCSACTCGWQP